MMNISEHTLATLAEDIRSGRSSPVSILEEVLERIDAINPKLNAYILLLRDRAIREAKEMEDEAKQGRFKGPLHGIPISLKDSLMTKGIRTTAGSKLLADWIPDKDAVVVEKLRTGGAITVGKTNLHEWAKGSSTLNPFFGSTKNAWGVDRIPGGSSGGSATAVAASLCFGSVGTDAAGSVRMPAALCGVVGIKPTFGRIAHFGVVPGSGSWSLDTVGLLTKTAEDAAIMLDAISGPDPRDKSSLIVPPLGVLDLELDLEGAKVGVVKGSLFDASSKEVRQSIDMAAKILEKLGMIVEEVEIEHLPYASAIWSTISRTEAWASHEASIKNKPEGYSRSILTRVILGKYIGGHHYLKAQRARGLLIREFDEAIKGRDCLIAPSTPIPAPTIEEYKTGYHDVDGRKEEVGGVYSFLGSWTIPFNLTGQPTISVPCGFSSDGMPLGLQIAGKPYEESKVLAIAHQYEKASGFLNKRNPI
ncbi:MAG: Asp-tRNA(Asn)/Glu-tRNA(Gln) amidotransferase GatCAB subunit A [Thaumarchaeota archaeon]|nr:Asp-tRNA(Asn)/Glu-tRNA(Gln) amidotransferase GatCAB subunit A [Nitrososphaerota archaeon]